MPQQLHKSPENLDEVKVTLDFVTRMIIYDSYLLGNTANGIQVKEKLQNRWSVSHTDEKKEFQIGFYTMINSDWIRIWPTANV